MDLKDPTMENYLAHYGVLGMKWGVRNAESRRRLGGPSPRVDARKKKRAAARVEKKRLKAPNAKYTKDQRTSDALLLGNRGVKRINKSMNQGKTLNQARLSAAGKGVAEAILVGGAVGLIQLDIATDGMLRNVVLSKTKSSLKNFADAKAAREAGKNAVNQLLNTDYISTLKPTKKRRGRYKITDL